VLPQRSIFTPLASSQSRNGRYLTDDLVTDRSFYENLRKVRDLIYFIQNKSNSKVFKTELAVT